MENKLGRRTETGRTIFEQRNRTIGKNWIFHSATKFDTGIQQGLTRSVTVILGGLYQQLHLKWFMNTSVDICFITWAKFLSRIGQKKRHFAESWTWPIRGIVESSKSNLPRDFFSNSSSKMLNACSGRPLPVRSTSGLLENSSDNTHWPKHWIDSSLYWSSILY